MAERTLAELEAGADTAVGPLRPSMDGALANNTEAYVKFLDVRGPYKVETRFYQQDAANDFAADDTFRTTIAHPLFVTVVKSGDMEDSVFNISASLNSLESDTNFRTVTLHDAEDDDGVAVVVTVYGF